MRFALTLDDDGLSIGPPDGRLTLASGVPVTASDVAGATTVYFTPDGGIIIPVFDGTCISCRQFDEMRLALDSDPGHAGYHQSGKNFDLFYAFASGNFYFGTGPAWSSDTARGAGAGTTEIECYLGMAVNKNSLTLRHGAASGDTVTIPARQGALLGSVRMTANGQTEDSVLKRFVSNLARPMPRPMAVTDATSTWTYSTASFRQANGSAANQVAWLHCLAGRPVKATAFSYVNNSTSTNRIMHTGVGIDSTSGSSAVIDFMAVADNVRSQPATAVYNGFPGLGYHVAAWLEKGAGTDTQTWLGSFGSGQMGLVGETLS